MAQNPTEPSFTRKQVAVLNAAASAGLNRTITAVCDEANVNRRTFYNWLDDDPDFKAAWDEAWYGTIRRHMNGVVAAQLAKALEGDTRAAEYVAKLAGVFVERTDHTTGGDKLDPIHIYLPSNGRDATS